MPDPITEPSETCIPFSEDNFKHLLQIVPTYPIERKLQVLYLIKYLKEIDTQTIVVENYYIDKYYMDDFLHFYANCLEDYPKHCKRLHFFSSKVDFSDLLQPLSERKDKKLNDTYLGFIVVKPIPNIVIGRTLLKSYPNTNSDFEFGSELSMRHILTLRNYKMNLFGNNLSIDSIPFQEQDSVISACATTALWTILEKATHDNEYYSPTPYEITLTASQSFTMSRPLPASGLNIYQCINVIRYYGMETEVFDFTTNDGKAMKRENFLSTIYAYLRGGIPIFLMIQIGSEFHAVAVMGFKRQQTNPSRSFTGDSIFKLYIHDDNIGPFARYMIKEETDESVYLECEDRKNSNNQPIKIDLINMIIPLYHKIRYPFSEIKILIKEIESFLQNWGFFDKCGENYEWDCYILQVNQFKSQFLKSDLYQHLPQETRESLLLEKCPRFIWRCLLTINNAPCFELLADATDAKIKMPFFKLYIYVESCRTFFNTIFADPISDSFFQTNGLFSFFCTELDLNTQSK